MPSFNSEHDAIEILKVTRFHWTDSADVAQSSWIVSANFLSCGAQRGFIILSARYTDYLYQDVPLSLWDQFKAAKDKESFHMKALKNKYDYKNDKL